MPIVRAGQAPLRVVVAPNAFKGSLTARAAAEAMAAGVRRAVPDAECVLRPIADGGDGSLDAFTASGFARRPVTTRGPTGAPVDASYATDGSTAVVELASTCGLVLLPGGVPAPMTSTTEGLGDAIRAALDERPSRIIVCLGGSASTDGGTGLLVALGARLLRRRRRTRPARRRVAGADRRPRPVAARPTTARHRHHHRRRRDQPAARAGQAPPPCSRRRRGPRRTRSPSSTRACARGPACWPAPPVGTSPPLPGRVLPAAPARPCSPPAARRSAPGAALIADLVGLDDAIAARRPRHHRRGPARRAERARQGSRRRRGARPCAWGACARRVRRRRRWTRPTCVRPASTAGATACRGPSNPEDAMRARRRAGCRGDGRRRAAAGWSA